MIEMNSYCPDMDFCSGRKNGTCAICPMIRRTANVSEPVEKATIQKVEVKQKEQENVPKLPEETRNFYMKKFMQAI